MGCCWCCLIRTKEGEGQGDTCEGVKTGGVTGGVRTGQGVRGGRGRGTGR